MVNGQVTIAVSVLYLSTVCQVMHFEELCLIFQKPEQDRRSVIVVDLDAEQMP